MNPHSSNHVVQGRTVHNLVTDCFFIETYQQEFVLILLKGSFQKRGTLFASCEVLTLID